MSRLHYLCKPRALSLLLSIRGYVFRVCLSYFAVPCGLVVVCWGEGGADLLALLYVMFSCVFVTFPCCVLGQVYMKYLNVSIPDLCLLPYFDLDRWVAGSRIIVGVVSLSNTFCPLLSTGSTQ